MMPYSLSNDPIQIAAPPASGSDCSLLCAVASESARDSIRGQRSSFAVEQEIHGRHASSGVVTACEFARISPPRLVANLPHRRLFMIAARNHPDRDASLSQSCQNFLRIQDRLTLCG